MSSILLMGAEVLGPDRTVRAADIAVDGNVIVAVGDAPEGFQPDRTVNCRGLLAIPGLVNTHTHAAMTLFRSYADDMRLMDWLQTRIWPAEARLTGEDVYWGTMLAAGEMIRSGTTTFADMYFFMDRVAEAAAESGLRAVLARGMAGVAPTANQALAESETFFTEWHGAADGRITVMLGPHAPYTCPPDYLKKVLALSERLGAEIHIHLSETAGEVADCLRDHGKTPIALMDSLGILERGVLAAHCVHLTPEDIRIMKEKNVRVAHNPGSNMKLASGVAPVPDLIAAGVTVGLGTDGAASNNNLDMLEEVRLAAMLHKVHRLDPLAVPAAQAVEMAGPAGADALGLGAVTGRLAAGYKADIALLDTAGLHWNPPHDRVSLLAYSAQGSDVVHVLADGRFLMENRILLTMDEARVRHEAGRRGLALVK